MLSPEDGDKRKALYLAAEAVEANKRARKPVIKGGYIQCPHCRLFISVNYEDAHLDYEYCPHCGQFLDWSKDARRR